MLRTKCEEYLGQIQRAADMLEHGKANHDMQLAVLNDKLDDVAAMLRNEQDRVWSY